MSDTDLSIDNVGSGDPLPPVVILEGGTTPLAIVRCLANAAIRPTVICYDKSAICRYSGLCDCLICPIAHENEEQLAEWLTEQFRSSPKKPFLLPATDTSVLFIGKYSALLGSVFLIWRNTHDDLMKLVSKERLYKEASDSGICVPAHIISPTLRELEEWVRICPGPYFVKPFYVSDPRSPLTGKNDAFEDHVALLDFVSKMDTDRLIIQQLLRGGDGNMYDCYGLCDFDGKIVSTATHLRIRQFRRDRGVTSFGEIPVTKAPFPPEQLISNTNMLFSIFKFHGVFGVEWLWDTKSKALTLVDVNARPFSSIGHLADSGLNLPMQAVQEISGNLQEDDETSLPVHLFWLDFSRDIYSAKDHIRTGDMSVKDWIRDIHRAGSYSYWRRDDMLPFLIASIRLCREILKSVFRLLSKFIYSVVGKKSN